jgi:hypothetical protein
VIRVSKLSFDMTLLYRSSWKIPRRFHEAIRILAHLQ